jgi:hypothetical protein
VRFPRGLSMLFIFFKEPAFCFADSLYNFLVSISLISALIFIISLLLFDLGFACSCFSLLSYLFYGPLITEQCVVQSPIVYFLLLLLLLSSSFIAL